MIAMEVSDSPLVGLLTCDLFFLDDLESPVFTHSASRPRHCALLRQRAIRSSN